MNFSGILCDWYEKNRRDLPWRHTTDPYLVWISEVILQQTRVVQGLDYYLRFAETFPDLNSLANASEDEVLLLWQGLGYYSRARNMHQAAKDLVEHNGGKMPENYKGLLEMKGVGSYTASAIASICFGEPRAVVDGNVARVLARINGIEEPVNSTAGKRIIDSLAAELLAGHRDEPIRNAGGEIKTGAFRDPGTHNQAVMEFGALQCVPSSPDCGKCPVSEGCVAFKTSRVNILPVKTPKRKPADRWMYFYILRSGEETILSKRDQQGIWRSLYHFPVIESSRERSEQEICHTLFEQLMSRLYAGVNEERNEGHPAQNAIISNISAPLHHQLSHLTLHARFIHIDLSSLPSPLTENSFRIPVSKVEDFPLPRLMERYMESSKI